MAHLREIEKSQAPQHTLAVDFTSKEDVVRYGQLGCQGKILVNSFDTLLACCHGRAKLNRMLVDLNYARIRLVNPSQALDECRFTRAIITHQADDLPSPEVYADIVQRLDVPEALGDVDCPQDGRHAAHPGLCAGCSFYAHLHSLT
jgi:hypothetical protein